MSLTVKIRIIGKQLHYLAELFLKLAGCFLKLIHRFEMKVP